MDLAGIWKDVDDELDKVLREIREAWLKWGIGVEWVLDTDTLIDFLKGREPSCECNKGFSRI